MKLVTLESRGPTLDRINDLTRNSATVTHAAIKQRTSAWHAKVDQMFSAFDLSERAPYTSFLRANASAIVPLENLLFHVLELPSWDPRSAFLLEDLEALNGTESASFQACVPMAFSSYGERLGALYRPRGLKVRCICP